MINETYVVLGLMVGVSMVGVLVLWKIEAAIVKGFRQHLKIIRENADDNKLGVGALWKIRTVIETGFNEQLKTWNDNSEPKE